MIALSRTTDFFAGLPEQEHSRNNAFGGATHDRLNGGRGTDALAAALKHAEAQFVVLHEDKVVLRKVDGRLEPIFSASHVEAFAPKAEDSVLIGRHENGPIVAVRLPEWKEEDGLASLDLRALAAHPDLSPGQLGALAHARSLTAWNAKMRHCVRCGGTMVAEDAGYKRKCLACGAEEFPRTDPVVIMLVIDGDRCLLGRGAHFRTGNYSCLAGFLEPGETIEAAVRREVLEEAGIRVGRVKYHSSQPWPFPSTLMIGCLAEARSSAIDFDRSELDDCRWFERGDVLMMMEGRHPDGFVMPSPFAIAHKIIRYWAEAE